MSQHDLIAYLLEPRISIAAPVYQVKLGHIFRDDELSFDHVRDRVVFALRESVWVKSLPDFDPVHAMLADLADTGDFVEFVASLESVRDQADYHRAMIDVISA